MLIMLVPVGLESDLFKQRIDMIIVVLNNSDNLIWRVVGTYHMYYHTL